MKENLNSLFAAGGGDGPEAATAALKAACDLVRVLLLTQDWRPDAAKMAILVTDAPPHGIGEYGDGFPSGSPDNEDPILLARSMSARGIPLFVVACEPALSGYQHAVDFYQGLVTITGGLLVPLTTASLLSHVVIAAAGEVMDLDRLHREVGDAVLDRMRSLSLSMGDDPSSSLMDQVTHELHEKLLLRNESTKQLIVESIYRESEGTLTKPTQNSHTMSASGARRPMCLPRAHTSARWSVRGSAKNSSTHDAPTTADRYRTVSTRAARPYQSLRRAPRASFPTLRLFRRSRGCVSNRSAPATCTDYTLAATARVRRRTWMMTTMHLRRRMPWRIPRLLARCVSRATMDSCSRTVRTTSRWPKRGAWPCRASRASIGLSQRPSP